MSSIYPTRTVQRSSNTLNESPNNAHHSTNSTRKRRVFTFQKRWLYTLPIIDIGDEIHCLLCQSNEKKRWNQLNCRRGRIETHLRSKHPEFMALLHQKRETKGELAAQIFLQTIRDGRCDIHEEVAMGLYGQKSHQEGNNTPYELNPTTNNGSDLNHMIRREGPGGPGAQGHSENQTFMEQMHSGDGSNGSTIANHIYPMVKQVRNLNVPWLRTTETSTSECNGTSIFAQKVAVVIGGEDLFMLRLAMELWSAGARVVVTFLSINDLEEFKVSSAWEQLINSGQVDNGRNQKHLNFLPIVCNFEMEDEFNKWTRFVQSQVTRVDFCLQQFTSLINQEISNPTSINLSRQKIQMDRVYTFLLQEYQNVGILNLSSCSTEINDQMITWTRRIFEKSIIQWNWLLLPSPITPIVKHVDEAALRAVWASMQFLCTPTNIFISGSTLCIRKALDRRITNV